MTMLGALVGVWFVTSDLEDLAPTAARIAERVEVLENHLRTSGAAAKIDALLRLTTMAALGLGWAFFGMPWSLIQRHRPASALPDRIVYLSHESALNGAPRSLLAILERLDRTDVVPLVICPAGGPLIEECRKLGVATIQLPVSQVFKESLDYGIVRHIVRLLISFPYLIKILPQASARLIHINSLASPEAGLAAKLLGIPVVWHIREAPKTTRWARFHIGLVRRLARHVICNSNYSMRVISDLGVPSQRLSAIHNCISDGHLVSRWNGAAFRRLLAVDSSTRIIGCVSRVSRDKGQDVLLRAAIPVLAGDRSIVLVFIGSLADRSFVEQLRQDASRVAVSERVMFTGVLKDIPEVMAGLDVHVMPSRWETFGRVALEAMAVGTPSVVSDSGGLPEVVEDGRSGLVFPNGDAAALEALLRHLLDDRALAVALSAAGVERARTHFGCCRHVDRIREVYDSLRPPAP